MKKVFFFALCSLFFSLLKAQTPKQLSKQILSDSNVQAKALIRTENDLKSGNWQDVLASFFQLGIQDITSQNRAIEFKANLFALKAKTDSTLLIDTNYIKQNFSRNFQFNFALKLDSQYRFNGAKVGFSYAIINRRDSSLLNLMNTPADTYFIQFMDSLQFVLNRYEMSFPKEGSFFKNPKDSILYFETKAIITRQLESGERFNPKLYPKAFLQFANFDIIEKNYRMFDSLYQIELAKVRQRPLLTLSAYGTFINEPGIFSEGKAELIYLQGLTKKGRNLELDVRASINMVDTITAKLTKRVEIKSTAGCNWAIVTARNNINKSLVEFKPHVEYSYIPKGLYQNEKKEVFSANAELRIRVMDNLWVPLLIKYDLSNKNFLGFLKVALNMNAFKKAGK